MATTEIEDDALRLETEGEDRLHLLRLTEAEAGLLEEVGETDTRTKEEEEEALPAIRLGDLKARPAPGRPRLPTEEPCQLYTPC